MADSPVYGSLAYEPPLSLWSLVENFVPQHERDEIKNMLGESLVEQSLELHQEVNTLLEIWRDYRDETSENFHEKRLPEPPAIRDRLKQEIRFFVESIREKAEDIGRNPDEVLRKHKTGVLDYAFQEPRPSSALCLSRPMTASSDGRDTPLLRTVPVSGRSSRASNASEEVEAMNDKLNILKLDEVKTHLRDTLEGEVEQLLQDIDFLQQCLDDEANYRSQSQLEREPTLTELREERGKLERELLNNEKPIPKVTSIVKESPPFLKKLSTPSPPKMKPRPPSNSAGSSRSGPVRASHKINTQVRCGREESSNSSGDNNHTQKSKMSSIQTETIATNMHDLSSPAKTGLVEHVFIRTGSTASPPDTPQQGISKLAPSGDQDANYNAAFKPSPPSSAKTSLNRPSSASRFRKMVQECREVT